MGAGEARRTAYSGELIFFKTRALITKPMEKVPDQPWLSLRVWQSPME